MAKQNDKGITTEPKPPDQFVKLQSGGQQLLVPATAPELQKITAPQPGAPPPRDWLDERIEYLVSRGWERMGMNERGQVVWSDPRGNVSWKGELTPTVELPMKGGGKEIISQLICPPTQWYCSTDEALLRQHQRDRANESLDEQIERKEKELAALKERKAIREAPLSAA